MKTFAQRVTALPHLGIGVSTEYGAAESPAALDIFGLHAHHPEFASFLEVGVEVSKGLDAATETWIERRLPTTYHFLDINLDEPDDFDEPWLASMRHFARRLDPAWMCGDAGLWHFGRRDRGHMLLLPPILSDESASATADGIRRLRSEIEIEVLPENPPGAAYVGDLHLLEFYRRVVERADTGMLLDCAHLAIYQSVTGEDPLTGLGDFPLDRVIEMHVAGGATREVDGFRFVEDSHTPAVLDATWTIFEYVAARAPNLRAVVFECERNPVESCIPGFTQIASILERVAAAPSFRKPDLFLERDASAQHSLPGRDPGTGPPTGLPRP